MKRIISIDLKNSESSVPHLPHSCKHIFNSFSLNIKLIIITPYIDPRSRTLHKALGHQNTIYCLFYNFPPDHSKQRLALNPSKKISKRIYFKFIILISEIKEDILQFLSGYFTHFIFILQYR